MTPEERTLHQKLVQAGVKQHPDSVVLQMEAADVELMKMTFESVVFGKAPAGPRKHLEAALKLAEASTDPKETALLPIIRERLGSLSEVSEAMDRFGPFGPFGGGPFGPDSAAGRSGRDSWTWSVWTPMTTTMTGMTTTNSTTTSAHRSSWMPAPPPARRRSRHAGVPGRRSANARRSDATDERSL